jgi:hypothetical protein
MSVLPNMQLGSNFRHYQQQTIQHFHSQKTTQLNSTHYTLSGGLSGASASATNCGPSAEPPIPTESI